MQHAFAGHDLDAETLVTSGAVPGFQLDP
jgi:hypothetical protein